MSYRQFKVVEWTQASNFTSSRKQHDNSVKWFFFKVWTQKDDKKKKREKGGRNSNKILEVGKHVDS